MPRSTEVGEQASKFASPGRPAGTIRLKPRTRSPEEPRKILVCSGCKQVLAAIQYAGQVCHQEALIQNVFQRPPHRKAQVRLAAVVLLCRSRLAVYQVVGELKLLRHFWTNVSCSSLNRRGRDGDTQGRRQPTGDSH